MTVLQEEDWERHRLWREDRDRRFAVRVAKQERLNALDPERYSLLVPVDDDEFPDESFTAGWADEEPRRARARLRQLGRRQPGRGQQPGQ